MLYSSLIAGIGISLVFSIAIFGAVRSGEKRRDHRTNAAFANDANPRTIEAQFHVATA